MEEFDPLRITIKIEEQDEEDEIVDMLHSQTRKSYGHPANRDDDCLANIMKSHSIMELQRPFVEQLVAEYLYQAENNLSGITTTHEDDAHLLPAPSLDEFDWPIVEDVPAEALEKIFAEKVFVPPPQGQLIKVSKVVKIIKREVRPLPSSLRIIRLDPNSSLASAMSGGTGKSLKVIKLKKTVLVPKLPEVPAKKKKAGKEQTKGEKRPRRGGPVICQHCGKMISNREKLSRHHKSCKGIDDNLKTKHPCEHCGKIFFREENLKSHLFRMHENKGKDCPCEVCGKLFLTKQEVAGHVNRVHKKIKSYVCQYCGQAFIWYSTLEQHLKRKHLNKKDDKNFVCETCGKGFRSKGEVKSHQEGVHLGIRNHACQECDGRFYLEAGLRHHVRTVHRKIKDFKCPICDMEFGQKAVMQRHVDDVHKKIRYKCLRCGKAYPRKYEFKAHKCPNARQGGDPGQEMLEEFQDFSNYQEPQQEQSSVDTQEIWDDWS